MPFSLAGPPRRCLGPRSRTSTDTPSSRHESTLRPHFPEGNSAHSRWSSAATPPDRGVFPSLYPGGIAARHMTELVRTAGIPPGYRSLRNRDRWCRSARPPAMGCDPSRGGELWRGGQCSFLPYSARVRSIPTLVTKLRLGTEVSTENDAVWPSTLAAQSDRQWHPPRLIRRAEPPSTVPPAEVSSSATRSSGARR